MKKYVNFILWLGLYFLLSTMFFIARFDCNSIGANAAKAASNSDIISDNDKIQTFIKKHLNFASLSTSYVAENSTDDGNTWTFLNSHQLDWIPFENKYRAFVITTNPSSTQRTDNRAESYEFFGENGKMTIVLGEHKDINSVETRKNKAVTIRKEDLKPFIFPFSFMFDLDNRLLSIREKTIRKENGKVIVEQIVSSKVNGIYKRVIFYFNSRTGAFLKKIQETINEKRVPIGMYSEFLVPNEEYFVRDGVFFPKTIIVKFYGNDRKYQNSVRYRFNDNIKINSKIPDSVFVPKFKNGTRIYNAIEKKVYTHDDGGMTEKETAKKLDELFNNAQKQQK